MLLAVISIRRFEEKCRETRAEGFDGSQQWCQAITLGQVAEYRQNMEALAGKDEAGSVEPAPYVVVELGCVVSQDDESALGPGVDLAFNSCGVRAGLEFEARIGFKAGAALDEKAEGFTGLGGGRHG